MKKLVNIRYEPTNRIVYPITYKINSFKCYNNEVCIVFTTLIDTPIEDDLDLFSDVSEFCIPICALESKSVNDELFGHILIDPTEDEIKKALNEEKSILLSCFNSNFRRS